MCGCLAPPSALGKEVYLAGWLWLELHTVGWLSILTELSTVGPSAGLSSAQCVNTGFNVPQG